MNSSADSTRDMQVVMVVDDSPDNLKLLSNILGSQGYEVRQALSGSTALRSIGQRMPDLIILDIRMPEMDGFEVCRRLKEEESTHGIPVIFISGMDESDNKIKAFTVGAQDFITKPFDDSEVLARVKLHLELHRLKRNLEEEVQDRTIQLEESNTALKVLLKHRDSEKETIEENVISHISSLVSPYLQRLKESGLDRRQRSLLDVVESNLAEITSHFSGKLYSKALGLTRREMEVAALIKSGKTNLEISELLCISEYAVSFHRQNLRKKLGLQGKKINLVAYLNEISIQ